jgi:hypothetical protein
LGTRNTSLLTCDTSSTFKKLTTSNLLTDTTQAHFRALHTLSSTSQTELTRSQPLTGALKPESSTLHTTTKQIASLTKTLEPCLSA